MRTFCSLGHGAMLCLWWLTVVFLPVAGRADTFEALYAQWMAGQYETVLPQLLEYRKNDYGRNLVVYYMIATSACRIDSSREMGYRLLNFMLERYRVDGESRAIIENEAGQCSSRPVLEATNGRPAQLLASAELRTTTGTAGVSSKMFHWLDMDNVALGDESASVVRKIPLEELKARLFPPAQAAQAAQALEILAGHGFDIVAAPPFLVASTCGHSRSQLRSIGETLGRVLEFYVTQYSMSRPEYLLTVYLVPDAHRLRGLAEKLHGIRVAGNCIGYSYRDDFSLIGVVPGMLVGTLKHELFHLLVRSRYGDIPAWLDEGMAALYEVSRFDGDQLVGMPNWRGAVLMKYWDRRPTIAELITADWQWFDAVNTEGGEKARYLRQASNHATARYLLLNLQENGQLRSLYTAMHQQTSFHTETASAGTARQVLEQLMNKDLSHIDEAFSGWFGQRTEMHLNRLQIHDYQRQLARAGFDPRGADGIIGTDTRTAIRAFQKSRGLDVTGRFDLETLNTLDKH